MNNGIPDELATVHYAGIDDAVRAIKKLGRGAFLVKLDIESAFKIVPIHPDDHHLLGMAWDGWYYYDKTLAMGLRSSCAIFERVSTALEWIARHKIHVKDLIHLLDDFLLFASSFERSRSDKENFIRLCQILQIPLAPDKMEGPATCMVFAGIELDTVKWEARLPEDKKAKCIKQIRVLLQKRKTTLRELQSLIGLLNFCCQVVVPGRAFLRRLINMTIGATKPFHHIRLTQSAQADLLAWLEFLDAFNGRAFFLSDVWLSSEVLHLYTDAAGAYGYAGIFQDEWFYGVWPDSWLGKDITVKELYPIVASLHLWSDRLANQPIVLHTDNMAIVHIINKMSSKDCHVMILIRKMVVICMQKNIYVKAEHGIP